MLLALLACHPGTTLSPAPTRRDGPAADSADDGDSAPEVSGLACGDGVAAAAEECDGTDDAACPGACSAHCQCPSAPATGELAIHVVDVWQGDGVLVVSPDGFTMLVDAGDEDDYWGIRKTLADEGIEGIDYTLVSHQHADHMGAMDWALDDHPEVGVAFDGGGRASTQAFEDYAVAAGDKRVTVAVGDQLDLGPSMSVDVLHANIGDRENENNNSVVIRVTHGEVTALLGGDCEFPTCERALDPGPIDVYKVHHHGSSDSSSPGLLDEMSPSTAIISCGVANDYGHPDDSVLDRLAARGVEVWRTDLSGNVVVRSDGVDYTVASSR